MLLQATAVAYGRAMRRRRRAGGQQALPTAIADQWEANAPLPVDSRRKPLPTESYKPGSPPDPTRAAGAAGTRSATCCRPRSGRVCAAAGKNLAGISAALDKIAQLDNLLLLEGISSQSPRSMRQRRRARARYRRRQRTAFDAGNDTDEAMVGYDTDDAGDAM